MRSVVKGPVIGAVLCFLGMVIVGFFAYKSGPLERLDVSAMGGLAELSRPKIDRTYNSITHAGDAAGLLVILALLAWYGLRRGRRREVAAALGAALIANVTTQVLKVVLSHPRYVPGPVGSVGPEAFPSGHATAAMSAAVAAVIIAPPDRRTLAAILGAAYAVLLSVGLVILAWHFPSDVLGGMLCATGFGFVAIAGLRWAEVRKPPLAVDPRQEVVAPAPGEFPLSSILLVGAGFLVLAGSIVLSTGNRASRMVNYLDSHHSAVAAVLAMAALAGILTAGLTIVDREAEPL